MILSFADFELDTDRYELRQKGRLCNTEPMVFDLISYFVHHPDQVFSRDALIEAVWSGRIVSDATVSTCVKNARKALGDSGATQNYLKTVRGRGFRFTARVTQLEASQQTLDANLASSSTSAESEQKTVDRITNTLSHQQANNIILPYKKGPLLLVLPFRTLPGNAEIRWFADSIADDINTILTRIPLLHLSSHSSAYSSRSIQPTVREIHEELGVDFVLEGSFHTLSDQTRINVQLSDAKSGFRLWAEHFLLPGPISESFDQGVINIIAKLEPQLYRAVFNSVRTVEGELSARELFLEASAILALKGWHPESFSKAATLLRRSWQLDTEFALAPSYLSLIMGFGHRVGLLNDRDKAKAQALAAAERSLQLDNMDSTVLGFSGCALADIGFTDRALPLLRNAVELNPNNAQAWAALGAVCLLEKRLEEAVSHLQRGIKISPMDSRLSIWGTLLAIALLQSNDIEGAFQQAKIACQRDDGSYFPRVVLAGLYIVIRDIPRSQNALADAYRIKPNLSPHQISALLGHKLGLSLLKINGSAAL